MACAIIAPCLLCGPSHSAPPTKKYCFTTGPLIGVPPGPSVLGAAPLVPMYPRPEASIPQFLVSQYEPSMSSPPRFDPCSRVGPAFMWSYAKPSDMS